MNSGLMIKMLAVDKSELLVVILMTTATEIKIKIDTSINIIKPAIQYGDLVDVYITCEGLTFKVRIVLIEITLK